MALSSSEREEIRRRLVRTGISPGIGTVGSLLDMVDELEAELKKAVERLDAVCYCSAQAVPQTPRKENTP